MSNLDLSQSIVERARRAGADEADVYLSTGREFEVTLRNGEVEVLKQARAKGVGIRIFLEGRMGFSHSTDFSDRTLDALVEQTVAMARVASRDEFNGLPQSFASPPASFVNALDLYDRQVDELEVEKKIGLAKEMEAAARGFDTRVKSVEAASYADGSAEIVLATSTGFSGSYRVTSSSLSCSVVAREGEESEIGHWYSAKRFLADLEGASSVGRRAAQRAVGMLGARKVPSGKFPVIFDARVAASFVGALARAVNGEAVYRNRSFLAGKLGERVASERVTIVDDGVMPRGFGSRPFDGEGVATSRKPVIDGGILKSYLYDSYTARKAKTDSTGNALRSYSSTPQIGPLNFYLQAGTFSPAEILASVGEGLYVVGLIGQGVDTVSGRYSRGAEGFWVKDGAIAFPVHEVTVAGTMQEMLTAVEMVGNDLDFLGSVACPTLKFAELTISGTAPGDETGNLP